MIHDVFLGGRDPNWVPTKSVRSAEVFSLNVVMMYVGEGCVLLQGPRTSHWGWSSGKIGVVVPLSLSPSRKWGEIYIYYLNILSWILWGPFSESSHGNPISPLSEEYGLAHHQFYPSIQDCGAHHEADRYLLPFTHPLGDRPPFEGTDDRSNFHYLSHLSHERNSTL